LTPLRELANTWFNGAAATTEPDSKSSGAGAVTKSGALRSSLQGEVYDWVKLKQAFHHGLKFSSIRLDMMRHGETTLNEKGRVSGSAPGVNLTERGMRQARDLAALLDPPYAFAFSSTLKRSRLTLRIALTGAGLRIPKRADRRLGERSLGELEGRRSRHIPEFAAGDLLFAPPGGENYLSVTQRCLSFLLDVQLLTKKSPGSRVLLCTHMGPMRVLKAIIVGELDPQRMMEYSFANTELLQLNVSVVQWPPFLEGIKWRQLEDGTATESSSRYHGMWRSIRRLSRA
jgi:broad specificity phosphatase PhoE